MNHNMRSAHDRSPWPRPSIDWWVTAIRWAAGAVSGEPATSRGRRSSRAQRPSEG